MQKKPDKDKNKKRKIKDLNSLIGDLREGGRRRSYLFETGITDKPGDIGASGDVGLQEAVDKERLDKEDMSEKENLTLPSDMRDKFDKDGGDVGVPGGLNDIDRIPDDKNRKMDEADLAGMGGAGITNQDKRSKGRKTKRQRKKR